MAQEALLMSGEGSHTADAESSGTATHFRAQLRGKGPLLELCIAGDGSCDIHQAGVEEASSSCPAFVLGLFHRGGGLPTHIPAADVVGATASGDQLVIWHAPLQGRAPATAEKPARRLQRAAPLVLESAAAAQQAAKLLRAACCCWPSLRRPPRLLVIVNPASGPGRAPSIYEKEVRPALEAAGCQLDMHQTGSSGHATELARRAAPDSVDGVVAIGGDGTMHEALQGLLGRPDWDAARGLPLAQVPCGSGNALAASVGMWSVHTALHAIVKGQARPLDVASVLQQRRRCFCFLSVNFGLITNLDIGTEHLRWMGGTRFVVGALQQILLKRKHSARVAILEADAGGGAAAAAFDVPADGPAGGPCNGSHDAAEGLAEAAALQGPSLKQLPAFLQLAGRELPPGWQWLREAEVALFTATNLPRLDMNFHLAPMAAPDSGCFDLIYTEPTGRLEGLQFLTASEKGQHMGMPMVRHRRVAALALEPQSTGTWLVVDGEVVPYSPLYLEVHPSLCSVLVAPPMQ